MLHMNCTIVKSRFHLYMYDCWSCMCLKHELLRLTSSVVCLYCMQFDASLFQWLYSCAQQKKQSRDLYTFVVQFSLDIILVYLHAVYENVPEVSGRLSRERMHTCIYTYSGATFLIATHL